MSHRGVHIKEYEEGDIVRNSGKISVNTVDIDSMWIPKGMVKNIS